MYKLLSAASHVWAGLLYIADKTFTLRKKLSLMHQLEVKVKVKLSRCLTKHHAMKTYSGVEV
jgi:hypothetical protein